MRTSKYLMVAGLLGLTLAAQADTLTLANIPNSAPKDASGNAISPYAGTLTIGSNTLNLAFSCDDFTHGIQTGTAYNNVTESTLTSANFLTATLFGMQVGKVFNGLTFTIADATALYQQVFYLSSLETAQLALNTSAGNTAAGTIQDAMWNLTNTYEPNNSTFADPPTVSGNQGTSYYLSQAAANYANYNYSNFTIVDAGAGSLQELFYSTGPLTSNTPEPATIAMVGSGLIALSFFRRKRKA